MLRFLFSALIVILLSSCKFCAAQRRPSCGVLHDEAGVTIRNASIVVTDSRFRAISYATSDDSGQYAVTVPVPGVYRATISFPGFKTAVVEGLQLSGGIVNLPVTVLQVGSATSVLFGC